MHEQLVPYAVQDQELAFVQRWSRKFGPVLKVDRMTNETIQNDEEKELLG